MKNLRNEFIKKYLEHLDLITEESYIDNFLNKYKRNKTLQQSFL